MHCYRCLGHLSFVPGAFRVAVTLTWRGVSCASDRPARRRRSVASFGVSWWGVGAVEADAATDRESFSSHGVAA